MTWCAGCRGLVTAQTVTSSGAEGAIHADAPRRVFEVACKGCRRSLATVERLRDAEITVVTEHLRGCAASQPLGDTRMLGAIMARLHVAATERA